MTIAEVDNARVIAHNGNADSWVNYRYTGSITVAYANIVQTVTLPIKYVINCSLIKVIENTLSEI